MCDIKIAEGVDAALSLLVMLDHQLAFDATPKSKHRFSGGGTGA